MTAMGPRSEERSKPAGQLGGGVPSRRGTTAYASPAVMCVLGARRGDVLHDRRRGTCDRGYAHQRELRLHRAELSVQARLHRGELRLHRSKLNVELPLQHGELPVQRVNLHLRREGRDSGDELHVGREGNEVRLHREPRGLQGCDARIGRGHCSEKRRDYPVFVVVTAAGTEARAVSSL